MSDVNEDELDFEEELPEGAEAVATEPEEADEDITSSGGKRLAEETWIEIETAYELGTKKMEQLSSEFGVSRQSISRRFKKRKVSFGSRAHELKAAVAAGVTAAVVAKAETYAEQRVKWVEETRVNGYKAIQQAQLIARMRVSKSIKDGAVMASIDDDLKAIARYQKILIDNALASLSILNADQVVDEASLPILTLRDITESEIQAIQRGDDDNEDEAIEEDPLAELEALASDD